MTSAPTSAGTVVPDYAPTTPGATASAGSLSRVKVAVVYERVTDGAVIGRNMADVIRIFQETRTDLIFRGFFRWEAVPASPGASMTGYPASYVSGKADIGYTYSQLGDAIRQIKAAEPGVIFIGAVAAQRLNRLEFNDETGEAISQDGTWAMALDPSSSLPKYTKEDGQCTAAKFLGWVGSGVQCPSGYDVTAAPAYFPDITNTGYQELLESWAEKQIDLGADGIWIDMLYAQASFIAQQTGNPAHPAVKTAFEASSKVVDDIHAYGEMKYHKHVYVGTWWTFAQLPYSPPDMDFVTVATPAGEVSGGLNSGNWDSIRSQITGAIGNKPVLVFIDWSGSASAPMGVFSQSLTPAQQDAFLTSADSFFPGKGMIFAFPVHGGTFPMNSARLSYGRYNVYDSLAPEFDTFGTIQDLAQKKG
ncbi:MAG TPA: hypothetical protein VMB35_05680 [Methanomicrobiales archaeon]|nr:hypothetical protein [Methanomicrobiales archaeon]